MFVRHIIVLLYRVVVNFSKWKIMVRYFFSLLIIFSLFACHPKQQVAISDDMSVVDTVSPRVIPISISDTTYRYVDQTFEQVSYVILSDDVLIGEIVRTLVVDDRIFILDNQNKIFCYNMEGGVEYVIDDYGSGPGEYGRILDFALNPPLKVLWMYDSSRRQLLCYDMFTGKRCQSISAAYMAPERMAIWNGSFFFFMGNHYNYPDNSNMHYSLFYSISGAKIDKSFFPHDQMSEFLFSYGWEHPFYYNDDKLYFINNYGTVVYQLTSESIRPLYKVELPDSLPSDVLMEVTPSLKLMQTRYSWLLSNAYETDGILNLWFQKQGYYYAVYYDLSNDKIIYAGKQVNNIPVKDLLFISQINGVYKNTFFSVVPSFIIKYKIDENPDIFPEDLKSLTEESNPVIAFYKVKR